MIQPKIGQAHWLVPIFASLVMVSHTQWSLPLASLDIMSSFVQCPFCELETARFFLKFWFIKRSIAFRGGGWRTLNVAKSSRTNWEFFSKWNWIQLGDRLWQDRILRILFLHILAWTYLIKSSHKCVHWNCWVVLWSQMALNNQFCFWQIGVIWWSGKFLHGFSWIHPTIKFVEILK